MKRRTLDVIFSCGGVLLAGLILVLGLVLQNQADVAESYVMVLFLASIAGFIHAFTTSKDEVVLTTHETA